MNLWIFNHYAKSPDLPGGSRHYDLGRELVRRGHRVVIFASSFHHLLRRETRLGSGESWRAEDVDGVEFVWLRTFPYQRNDWRRVLGMVIYMLRARRLGRRLPKLALEIERPDVVIGSSVHLLAVLAAYWVAKHHRAKFIMEVRDLWPQTLIDMKRAGPHHPAVWVLGALERFLYRRAGRIVKLLPGAGTYMTAHGAKANRIVYIPNGAAIGSEPRSVQPASEAFTVMYVGAHGEANALDVLLDTANEPSMRGGSFRFVLVGNGPEKERLMSRAESMGLDNVEFRDAVPKECVPDVLAEANVAIVILRDLPIYRYGISLNKLFDYMAAARPILFVGKSLNSPVSDSGGGVVVEELDPAKIATALVGLADMSKEDLEAIGLKGWAHAKTIFATDVLARRFLEEVVLPLRSEGGDE